MDLVASYARVNSSLVDVRFTVGFAGTAFRILLKSESLGGAWARARDDQGANGGRATAGLGGSRLLAAKS